MKWCCRERVETTCRFRKLGSGAGNIEKEKGLPTDSNRLIVFRTEELSHGAIEIYTKREKKKRRRKYHLFWHRLPPTLQGLQTGFDYWPNLSTSQSASSRCRVRLCVRVVCLARYSYPLLLAYYFAKHWLVFFFFGTQDKLVWSVTTCPSMTGRLWIKVRFVHQREFSFCVVFV